MKATIQGGGMSHLKKFGGCFLLLALSFFQTAYCYDINTPIVQKKLKDVNIDFRRSYGGGSNGLYHLPEVRPMTLRDSGRNQTLMFIENTNFHYIGNVGFFTPHLVVTLKPNNPTMPVVFDDPTSFTIQIHKGSVILSHLELDDLFNKYVFNVPNTTLKDLKINTSPGVLTLSGNMFRDKWIPFVMKGNIVVKDGHYLYFNPTSVQVNGVDATHVLSAANVKLAELLKFKGIGATLDGSTIILDAQKLFPPPNLEMKIKNAKLDSKGLVLEFDDGHAIKPSIPFPPSRSHIVLRGGDVKFTRVLPINVALQIDNIELGKELDFCLYRYRDQIAQGHLTLNCKGEIHVFFPTTSCAY